MWIVISVMIGTAVLIGLGMYAVGAKLPVGHVASVVKTVNAPTSKVWAALTDIEAMPVWRKELKSIQRTEGKDGLPRWVEKSSFGDIPLQVEEMAENEKLVARIDDKSLEFGGKWTWSLKPSGNQTEVTITEDGEVYSPMFRFMSKYVFGHSKTLQTYADQLAAHFQTEAK
jgi:uncharacterized protein YndB with AHSA1/START domain